MSISVDVSLHKRNWLRQNVKASADQIYVEDLVIAHDAEHAIVVVSTHLRVETYNNPAEGMRLDNAFSLREAENIVLVCDELEAGWQI